MPTPDPEDPNVAPILRGDYDPPGDVSSMAGIWRSEGVSFANTKVGRIWADLCEDSDLPTWPESIGTPTVMLQDANDWLDWTHRNDPDDVPPYDPVGLTYDSAPIYAPNMSSGLLLQECGISDYDPTPPDPDNPRSQYWSNAFFDARHLLLCKWYAYITRCKVAMARATQFDYSPAHLDFDNDNPDMAYTYISSLYRVNQYMTSSEHASDIESNGNVTQVAAQMDTALHDYADATGVTIPAGATTVAGKRFPVSKAWWTGKLPEWHRATGGDGENGRLDTREICVRFRQLAHQFRGHVGALITGYIYQDALDADDDE